MDIALAVSAPTLIFLSLGEAIRSENNRPNTVSMFKN